MAIVCTRAPSFSVLFSSPASVAFFGCGERSDDTDDADGAEADDAVDAEDKDKQQ